MVAIALSLQMARSCILKRRPENLTSVFEPPSGHGKFRTQYSAAAGGGPAPGPTPAASYIPTVNKIFEMVVTVTAMCELRKDTKLPSIKFDVLVAAYTLIKAFTHLSFLLLIALLLVRDGVTVTVR